MVRWWVLVHCSPYCRTFTVLATSFQIFNYFSLMWTPCIMHKCVISTMFGPFFIFFQLLLNTGFMWDQRGCSKNFYFKILNEPIIVWLLLQIFGVITMFWLPVLLQIPGVSLHLINDLGVTEFIGSGKRYPNCLTPSTNLFIYLNE
jgi:hypothetical protein